MSDLGIVLTNKNSADSKQEENVFQKNDSFGTTNTRLTDFLAKTSYTTAADIIDPLATFDVQFKFFPDLFSNLNGIYGRANDNQDTFLYKLTTEIMKVGSTNTLNSYNANDGQLILDMGYYVLAMTIPNMTMPEASKVPTLFGEFPANNLYVKPDNNNLILTILNTKIPIHDYIFYPWMREVTMPIWSYDKQPYTTATVTVKFDKHSDSRYVFVGCRPTIIASRQPTQEPEGDPTRDVTLLFDYMYITSADDNKGYVYNLLTLENATDFFSSSEKMQNRLINSRFS